MGAARSGIDDIPDFGDLDGLARLCDKAVDHIMVMDIPDEERQAMLGEIKVAFEAAVAGPLQ